ncbi:hypothetical protein [Flavobacterium sp. AED]|uniref:hypothetical protein n=1 Tax=Flavobacterium sp. AED TaxID=1423323 RepID=UPI00057CB7E5|nr:hypothetical protein [Flavobacterium sp. AED]KIA87423.1 hypothetical protein OA85_07495 [Flavobacterium sp. AED]
MKKKILLFGMTLSILAFTSCSQDSNSTTAEAKVTSNDVTATQKMDNAIDDVSLITDNQYEVSEGSTTGKSTENYHSLLPSCASVSDLGSTSSVRVLTITFGTETSACIFRGHSLKGQIILTRTVGTTFPKIITVTYHNFYVNENKLEGTSTWKREMLGTGDNLHPKTTFTMTGMTLTTTAGVYTRNGDRIREMTAGFLTRLSPTDDLYSTYGTFTTTHPNGTIFTSLIESTTPLVHKTACSLIQIPMPFPVSGILKLSKNSHYATIDYGTGDCDNLAMLSIDGGTATQITLGN